MITVHDLSVAYASGHEVLHRLHCEIPFGAVTGIVGENGSGKSTFLHALVGLLPVPRSCFRVGEGVLDWRDIAFLPAEPYLYPSILAEDYLRVFERDKERIKLWEQLLDYSLKTPVSALSSGMRKKLALADVMAFRRKVVVLGIPKSLQPRFFHRTADLCRVAVIIGWVSVSSRDLTISAVPSLYF